MADQFKRIRSSVVDGRAQTPRYIQKQLTKLHDALRKQQKAINSAICRDTEYTSTEADLEIYLTLQALRQEYEALDFKKFLEQEYSVAHGKDNSSRRLAVGCVYIIPSQHSRFYSIIQSVSAAIASGNCVMVEIGQTTSELGSLIRTIFRDTMDKDTFVVVESKPSDQDFLSQQCVVVDSRTEPGSHTAFSTLSTQSTRTVAVVDRSSNVAEAARDLVRACFTFRGTSPYSPDVALVNEFVLKDFCTAAARSATEHVGSNISDETSRKSQVKLNSDLQKELQKSGASTLISGSRGSIVLIKDRKSSLLSKKVSEPVLIVHPIKSLDDAIEIANSGSTPLLATYIFAAPTSAKYLSQFVNASASFVNHVPVELLVGPAAPSNYPISLASRFTKEMFSNPRPELVTPSAQSAQLAQFLDGSKGAKDVSKKVATEFSSPLPSMNEPAGKAIGFFEQGLVTGGSVVVVSAITGLAVLGRYAGPAIWRRVR